MVNKSTLSPLQRTDDVFALSPTKGRRKENSRLDDLFETVLLEIPRQPLYEGETRPFGMSNLLASQTLRIPKLIIH